MKLSRIVLIVIVIVVAIQLYRPGRNNPAENPAHNLKAVAQVPPEVDQILARSCNDCHSYNTTWPWYSRVAPVSWLVTSDVNDGRRHLNLSEWTALNPERQQRKLTQICTEVDEGEMPLKQYTWIHKETPLNRQQRDLVCNWTKEEQKRITEKTGVQVPPPSKGGMHAEEKK
jgi:Haem-binding domain